MSLRKSGPAPVLKGAGQQKGEETTSIVSSDSILKKVTPRRHRGKHIPIAGKPRRTAKGDVIPSCMYCHVRCANVESKSIHERFCEKRPVRKEGGQHDRP